MLIRWFCYLLARKTIYLTGWLIDSSSLKRLREFVCCPYKILRLGPSISHPVLFKSLFNGDIEKCFRNRLVAACGNRQHVVINCCTKIGRTQINKILRELGVRFLQMAHPSSWWRHNDIPDCFVNGSGERKPFSAELLRTVVVPDGVDGGNVFGR